MTQHLGLRRARNASIAAAILMLAGCASQTPAPTRQSTSAATIPDQVDPQAGQLHVVRPGDTLMGIGRIYGQNVNDLVVWNNLGNPNQIHVGQQIRVTPEQSQQADAAQTVQITPILPQDGMGGVSEQTNVVHEPQGGRQPYSDSAWAAVRPDSLPSAPATIEVPSTAAADSAWLWPATGELIAGFDEATNKGVDIAGNPGDPVTASSAGSVVYSGSGLRGYGKLVIIKHDDDYLTAYAHNQALLVKEGDNVTKGQRIAELGSTDADRPKLHFEIRRQGRPVDPMEYLPAR